MEDADAAGFFGYIPLETRFKWTEPVYFLRPEYIGCHDGLRKICDMLNCQSTNY